jgi:hypothetical protein
MTAPTNGNTDLTRFNADQYLNHPGTSASSFARLAVSCVLSSFADPLSSRVACAVNFAFVSLIIISVQGTMLIVTVIAAT